MFHYRLGKEVNEVETVGEKTSANGCYIYEGSTKFFGEKNIVLSFLLFVIRQFTLPSHVAVDVSKVNNYW